MSRLADSSRALRASGLIRVWAVRYPPLREPGAAARAAGHVAGSLAALAPPYRVAFTVLLRLVPLGFRLLTGRRLEVASPRALSVGARRLERLPVLGTVVRTTGALACCGALDGVPMQVPGAAVPAGAAAVPAGSVPPVAPSVRAARSGDRERAWPRDPR